MTLSKEKLRLMLDEQQWIASTGYLVFYIVILAAFYRFMISDSSKRLVVEKNEIVHLKSLSELYKGFPQLKSDFEAQKVKLKSVCGEFEGSKNPGDKSNQAVLEAISDICRQSDINFDKLNPVNENGEQGWALNFTADYKRITKFLAATEKAFKVSKVSLRKGPEKEHYLFNVTISALPCRAQAPSVADAGNQAGEANNVYQLKGSLFDIYEKAKVKLEKIEAMRKDMQIGAGAARDPLQLPEEQAPKKVIVEAPRLNIEGIFWDPKNPLAAINGKVLKAGESVNGVKIIKVRETSVTVEWRGHEFVLKTKKELK